MYPQEGVPVRRSGVYAVVLSLDVPVLAAERTQLHWNGLFAAFDWKAILTAIASGAALGLFGFGARALLTWWRAREDSEFWPAQTQRLLMQMYRHQGRAFVRVKKEPFEPPYILEQALAGNEMFSASDLAHLVAVGLAENKHITTEGVLYGAAVINEEHAITPLGTKWAKRLIKREERALARIRP